MHWLKVENENMHIWELFSVLAFLQVLDIIFSYITFSMGGIELNPIMIFAMSQFGVIGGMIIFKFIILTALYLFLKYGRKKIRYKIARNILYIGIVPYIMLTSYHIINILIGIGMI